MEAMTCPQVAPLLSAYVDGELESSERSDLKAHLTDCAACSEQIASIRSLKHTIARLASREKLPGAVSARVETLRFERASDSSARRPAWLAGVALLFVAILAVAIMTRRSPAARLAEDLVSDHLHWQAEADPAQVVSEDPQEVKKFFEGRVPFAPIAPRLQDARLSGGRLCNIEGRRAQLLFYTCDRHTLSLFVLDRGPGDSRCRESRGRHVCGRKFGELIVLAVCEIPGQTLEKMLREATL
jgi:anti-sigma factor RsiW